MKLRFQSSRAVLILTAVCASILWAGTALAAPARYGDVASIPDWARPDVEMTSQFRVFRGDDSGAFRPQSAISRAEFTAILMRAFSLRPNTSIPVPFADVAGGWYTEVVTKAVQTNVIQGPDFGAKFMPNQAITRAEMARMVARAVDARRVVFTPGPAMAFSDVPQSHPFAEAIDKATRYGIINGMPDGTFQPGETATRAQAAVMIARAMRLGKPQELDVEVKLDKAVNTGARNVFFGSVELAATRQQGESVNLASLARWLSVEAQQQLVTILNRDIPAAQPVGLSGWWVEIPRYIGEDHAILPGQIDGVQGTVEVPVQRQFDGVWKIVDIPFERIDTKELDEVQPSTVTFAYTDASGSYFDTEYEAMDVSAYINYLANRPWAGGTLRVLRIGGQRWEATQFQALVSQLHLKMEQPKANARHYMVTDTVAEPQVDLFESDYDFVIGVLSDVFMNQTIYSIDGLSWERIAEHPFFRELIASAPTEQRYLPQAIVIERPGYWVPKFMDMIAAAKGDEEARR